MSDPALSDPAVSDPIDRLQIALDRKPPVPWGQWIFYNAIHLVGGLYFGIKSLRRARKRGYAQGTWTRLRGGDHPPREGKWLVLHAGGLGETRIAARIAQTITEERGGDVAILTRADDAFSFSTGEIFLGRLPFNNVLSSLIFLLRWRPWAIITIEFHDNHHQKVLARLLGIPQIVVNTPITEEEVERVLRKRNDLWRWMPLNAYLVPSEVHRERFLRIGLPPDRVITSPPMGLVPLRAEPISREELGIAPDAAPIILAGSTYAPEERLLLELVPELRRQHPKALVVLAPRRLKRSIGEEGALDGAYARRSLGEPPRDGVLVLDTHGELRSLYAHADFAYVGGTYEVHTGGHTPMEAIAEGVPFLIGPEHPQQKRVVDELVVQGAGVIANSADEIKSEILRLAASSRTVEQMREAALKAAREIEDPTLAVYDALVKSLTLQTPSGSANR